MKLYLSILYLCVLHISLAAQFTPAPVYPEDTSALFTALSERFLQVDEEVPEKLRESYLEIGQDRLDDLKEEIRDSQFLFRPELTDYLTGQFGALIDANGLQTSPLILVRRSQSSNASSLGNGVFSVNLGLLYKLATDEEVSFVLCHEMAHDQLEHLRTGLVEFLSREKNLSGVRKKLSRAREKKARTLFNTVRSTVYNSYRLKRKKELEADSLGFIYYSALSASPKSSTAALSMLAMSDIRGLHGVDFKSLMATEGYPIKDKWLAPPTTMFDGSFGSQEKTKGLWDADSTSTHPNLDERQEQLAILTEDIPELTEHVARAHGLEDVIGLELIRAQLDLDLAGLAYINVLRLLHLSPEDETLQALLGESLLYTYQSIISYDFDKAIPPPNFFHEPNAREAILMLRQIRKSELKKLTLAYLSERNNGRSEGVLYDTLQKANTYFSSND